MLRYQLLIEIRALLPFGREDPGLDSRTRTWSCSFISAVISDADLGRGTGLSYELRLVIEPYN